MTSSTIKFIKRPTLFAFNANTGEQVNVGDTVTSFRGEKATVTSLSRAVIPGKSGKVVVRWIEKESGPTDFEREYYDSVFDLVVTDVAPGEYDVFTLDGHGDGVLWARNVKAHNVIHELSKATMDRGVWGGDYHPSK
jgi:hypothetical protein